MAISKELIHSFDDKIPSVILIVVQVHLPGQELASIPLVGGEELLRLASEGKRTNESLVVLVERDRVSDLHLLGLLPEGDPLCVQGLTTALAISALWTTIVDLDQALQVTLLGPQLRQVGVIFLDSGSM